MFTADGIEIVEGLRVFTNNLDRGTVSLEKDHHGNFKEWFEVILDHNYKGQPCTGSTLQDASRVTTRFQGEDA